MSINNKHLNFIIKRLSLPHLYLKMHINYIFMNITFYSSQKYFVIY